MPSVRRSGFHCTPATEIGSISGILTMEYGSDTPPTYQLPAQSRPYPFEGCEHPSNKGLHPPTA
jgi:hypothetical protein